MKKPKKGVSQNVPVGSWTHVRKGKIIAEDTYVDALGVLRQVKNGSCVVWHHNCRVHGRCDRKGIQPSDIVYDDNGAPWCPDCIGKQSTRCRKW